MTENPRRGEVWLVDHGDPVGHEAAYRRPALVVSDDAANRHALVVVCPIGTTRSGYPTRVELEPERSGLDHVSYVQCEQIRTISAKRLTSRLGSADVSVIAEVERVLRLLLRL